VARGPQEPLGLGRRARRPYAYFTDQPGFYLSAVAYGTVYARNLRRWALERREEREAARRYHEAVTAPMSPEAAAYLRKRLEDGTAPRRKVFRKP
jgi:hypothetical protein